MALEKELKKAPPKSFKRHLTGLKSLRTSFLSFAIGVRKHKKAEARPPLRFISRFQSTRIYHLSDGIRCWYHWFQHLQR